jgi:hypothetical protein
MAPGEYTVRISGGLLRNGKVAFKNIAAGKISGLRGDVKFKPLKGRGTFVYRADVLLKGKNIFTAEAAAAFGGATSGLYTQRLPGEKIKDSSPDNAKLNLNFNSTEIATPHIKWAKPYAGGKIKVLALNTELGGIRDMIEMKQRFDMDLTTNLIAGMWRLSGHVRSLSVKSCLNELARQLKKEYDLYVITSHAWQAIGKDNAALILEKVAQGAGLVMTEADPIPGELGKFVKLHKKGISAEALPWTGDFMGIAPELLPPTRVRPYAKMGKVTATAGGYPLAGTFNYGKGKVYNLAWLASDPRGIRRKSGIVRPTFFLPQMSYGPLSAIPQYAYYEYQMAYFGKVLFDAAQKKTAVIAGKLSAVPGTLTVELEAASALNADMDVTVRNKFSVPVQQLTVGTLQAFLDEYAAAHPEIEVDYIHGEDSLTTLATQENAIGFLFDGMQKDQLFRTVIYDGALPRKTFSMGHARDKRYYMECRRIR